TAPNSDSPELVETRHPAPARINLVTGVFNFSEPPSEDARVSGNTCNPSSNESLAARSLETSADFFRSRAPLIWPLINEPYLSSNALSLGKACGSESLLGSPA